MKQLCIAAGGFVLLSAAAIPAAATPITETYDFSAPFNNTTWAGSFTVTYDPTVASHGVLTTFSSNLPAGYGTFTYGTDGSGDFAVGDNCGSQGSVSCVVNPGQDQAFMSFLIDASGVPHLNGGLNGVSVITDTAGNEFFAFPLSVTIDATPVPGPIVGAGLPGLMMAGAGLLVWSRRKRSAPSAA